MNNLLSAYLIRYFCHCQTRPHIFSHQDRITFLENKYKMLDNKSLCWRCYLISSHNNSLSLSFLLLYLFLIFYLFSSHLHISFHSSTVVYLIVKHVNWIDLFIGAQEFLWNSHSNWYYLFRFSCRTSIRLHIFLHLTWQKCLIRFKILLKTNNLIMSRLFNNRRPYPCLWLSLHSPSYLSPLIYCIIPVTKKEIDGEKMNTVK